MVSWRKGAGQAEGALGCVEEGVRLTAWGLSAPIITEYLGQVPESQWYSCEDPVSC